MAVVFGSEEANQIVKESKLIQARLDAFIESADYLCSKIECGNNSARSLTKVLVPEDTKPEYMLLEMTI